MNTRILTTLDAILIGIAWVEYVDISIRVGSGLAALVVGWYAIQAYRAQKNLAEYNLRKQQAEDKQMAEKVKQNGHKR
jgi:hypothetical protein